MSSLFEYFKAKTWALLHDPPNKMWIILGKGRCFERDHIKGAEAHENEAVSFWYELGLTEPFGDISTSERAYSIVKDADYLSSSMDRWLLERLGASGVKLDYHRLHNIFNPTLSVELKDINCNNVRKYIGDVRNILGIIDKVSDREERARAKHHLLYSLYDLMWIKEGLPPSLADTRMPTHTVLDHDYATATTVNMLWPNGEIGGYLVEVDIPGIQRIVNAARKAGDFWAGSWLVSMLAWLTVWPLVWEYGPDIVIRPTLRLNPIYHVTLLRYLKRFIDVSSVEENILKFYANVMFRVNVGIDEASLLMNPIIPGTITLILPQEIVKSEVELEETIRGYFEKAYKCLVEWALTGLAQGGQTPSDCDDVKTLLNTPQDGGNSYLKLAREVYERLKGSGVFDGLIQVRVTVVNLRDVYNCVLNSLTGSASGCSVRGLDNKVLSRYLNALNAVRNKVSNEELARYLTFTAGLEALHGKARVLGRSRLVIGKAWFTYDGNAVTKPMAGDVDPYRVFVFHGGRHDVGYIYCSICGEEPAIIHLRRDADNPNQYDRDTQSMLAGLGLGDNDINNLSAVYVRPGEALGPLCFLKRAVYYRFKQLYGGGVSMFDSTEDTSFAWFMKLRNDIKLRDCKTVEEYLSGETKSVTRLCGGSTDCTAERAREIFNRCIDTTEGLNEVLSKAINELVKDLGVNVDGLRLSPDRALVHFRSYYAIIRGDADNVGKLNRGEVPVENYEQFLRELSGVRNELRSAYEGVTKVIKSLGGVLVTPTYLASLSMALMITALRDTAVVNYAVPTNPVTGLIFSGGDDVLALAPVELAVKMVRDLRRSYWGDESGFHRMNGYYVATPKVGGFGRSFSMRYVNIMDNMNEEILATYELLEHVSKNATWVTGNTMINKDTLVISESRTGVRAAIPLSGPSHEVSRVLDLLNLLFILRIGGILSSNLPEDYEGYSGAVAEIIGRNNEQLLDSVWTFLVSRNMTSGTREERLNTIQQLNLHIEGMRRQYDVTPQLTLKLNNETSSLINEIVNAYMILRGYP